MSLGGDLGGFVNPPPPGYAGMHEAAEPGREITFVPFRCLGNQDGPNIIVAGPPIMSDFESFVPAPIDTSSITLPDSITSSYGNIRDMLATNIHEVWGKNKIESGFSYAAVRRWEGEGREGGREEGEWKEGGRGEGGREGKGRGGGREGEGGRERGEGEGEGREGGGRESGRREGELFPHIHVFSI